MSDTLQSALESGQEARIVPIDFSATFYRVNHQRILNKFCSVGIGDSKLSIFTQFQSYRSSHVMVDGCQSKPANAVSGVPQGRILGPLLFTCTPRSFFSILEKKLIGWPMTPTLIAVVPSPGVRVTVPESLIRDLGRVSEWCDFWAMKLNASKTVTMIVFRSRNASPVSHINYLRNCAEGV